MHQETAQRGLQLFRPGAGGDWKGHSRCLLVLEGLFWVKGAPYFWGAPVENPREDTRGWQI